MDLVLDSMEKGEIRLETSYTMEVNSWKSKAMKHH